MSKIRAINVAFQFVEHINRFLGRTTGSHLQLPRDVEFQEPVIWSARVENGRVAEWRLYPHTPEVHEELGIRFDEES